MVYTADHGQNLMDRGVMLQCNSRTPHEFEGLVPMLLISGDRALRPRLQAAADTNRDRTTHFQVFPTLLELFGYRHSDVAVHYPEGLLAPVREQPLSFSFGPIVGSSKRKIRWHTMPTDLRQLTR